MIFSAHVVDTNPLAALRRTQPSASSVPGLRAATTATGARFTPGVRPSPQFGREVLLAQWDDEAALDRFLSDDPTGRAFAAGWTMKLELMRAVGVWPGSGDDVQAVAAAYDGPRSGPTVAVTIGTVYLKSALRFLKVNSALEDQFLDDPGGTWGTAMTNLRTRVAATLTVWESSKAAMHYMMSGAHHDAVLDHYDPAVDPTGHTFLTGGGFFGFRPLSSTGSVGGKNPGGAHLLDSLG